MDRVAAACAAHVVRFEREWDAKQTGEPGRIQVATAAWANLAPWDDASVAQYYGPPGDEGGQRIAEHVQREADYRARWRWALMHPFGGDGVSLRMLWKSVVIRLYLRAERRELQRERAAQDN